MSADTAVIKTIILKSDSKKLLLFSMFGLCQRLDVNDYILYDGNRAWKCTIQAHVIEELERFRVLLIFRRTFLCLNYKHILKLF